VTGNESEREGRKEGKRGESKMDASEGDLPRLLGIYDRTLPIKGVKGLRAQSLYLMLEKRLEQPRICTNS
jgi:hypothetical protein